MVEDEYWTGLSKDERVAMEWQVFFWEGLRLPCYNPSPFPGEGDVVPTNGNPRVLWMSSKRGLNYAILRGRCVVADGAVGDSYLSEEDTQVSLLINGDEWSVRDRGDD
jgi:hypothetical protein